MASQITEAAPAAGGDRALAPRPRFAPALPTPEAANARRLDAEAEKAAAAALIEHPPAGATAEQVDQLRARWRDAEQRALAAALDIGRGVPQVEQRETDSMRSDTARGEAIAALAKRLKLSKSTVKVFAQLAAIEREHPAAWASFIATCLERGKPITQKGLLGLVKPERESGSADDQIAFRPGGPLAAAIDERRAMSDMKRTPWVRDFLDRLLVGDEDARREQLLALLREVVIDPRGVDAVLELARDVTDGFGRGARDAVKAIELAQQHVEGLR